MRLCLYLMANAVFMIHAVNAEETNMQKVLFGAIRWDYWSQEQMDAAKPSRERAGTAHGNMAKKQWAHRLPLYAKVVSEDPYKVDLRADTPEVMDLEIQYARQAGLDYWAFLYYPSIPAVSRCREIYLQSARKRDVGFCLIVARLLPSMEQTQWEDNIAEIVRNVKEPSYQLVAGGRPLIYLFFWDRTPEQIWGSLPEAKNAVTQLRKAVRDAGFKNPYLVCMRLQLRQAANYLQKLDLDAVATYVNFGGKTYEGLAQSNVDYWEEAKQNKVSLILTVNCGWGGPRPSGKINSQPTPKEFKEHLERAVDWEKENPELTPANSILMYAWNEFDEGGFLCPTRGEQEGLRKIDQLRRVVDGLHASQNSASSEKTESLFNKPDAGDGK